MNRIVVILYLFFCFPLVTLAQYQWDLGFNAGASNYLGDIGGNEKSGRGFIADIKFSKTKLTAGAFARYKLGSVLSTKLAVNYLGISGSDKLSSNPSRNGRNLSFRNNIYELALTGEFYFINVHDLGHTYRNKNDFRMYLLAGIGAFYHNPQAYYNGEWVSLRPLQTEGVNYKKIVATLPLGIGFYFTINKHHRIGWEISSRYTFTDYLDDISSVYVDPSTLSSKAAALANRRNELGAQPGIPLPIYYGTAGSKRGNASDMDTYLSTSLSYSYVIRGKSSFYKARHGTFYKKARYKKRKMRAKF